MRSISWLVATLLALALPRPLQAAEASEGDPAREEAFRAAMKDARWTGPMIASPAETLPKGHFYTEPYLYVVNVDGEHIPGSTGFYQYGVTDSVTVGFQPSLSFGRGEVLGVGDLKLLGQLRLTHFTPQHRVPTVSVVVNESLPLGKHDRLRETEKGHGSGAFATDIGVNIQHYFLLANGRLLRGRINVRKSFPASGDVTGRSVYGTPVDFRGQAHPASTTTAITAVEYSLNKEWVLALDLIHEWRGVARVEGRTSAGDYKETFRSGRGFSFAPAVEYNWDDRTGVLVGLWVNLKGPNRPKSLTPGIALSRFW